MATRDTLRKAETMQECINIYEEFIKEIRIYEEKKQDPPGGFKPLWNTALEALTKALRLSGNKESTNNIFQLASRHKERKNFVGLAKKAKQKIASLPY